MNKKAESAFAVAKKTVFWTVASIFIIGIILFFGFYVKKYENIIVQVTPQSEAELLALRFTNSPECFAYTDPHTGKVFPGIIDNERFNQQTLQQCYQSGSRKEFNFQLVLGDITIDTDEWAGVSSFTLFKSVIVKTGDEMKNARLIIYVQETV